MSEISLLSIFFKLVNFVIIIGILQYIYKHYMAASLKAAIHENIQKITAATRALFDNERTIEQLKNNVIVQQAAVEDLGSKLQKWQDVREQESQALFQQQQLLIEAIDKKRAVQSFYLSHHIVEKEIMRTALRAANKELADHCSSSDKKHYFDALYSFMQAELQR